MYPPEEVERSVLEELYEGRAPAQLQEAAAMVRRGEGGGAGCSRWPRLPGVKRVGSGPLAGYLGLLVIGWLVAGEGRNLFEDLKCLSRTPTHPGRSRAAPPSAPLDPPRPPSRSLLQSASLASFTSQQLGRTSMAGSSVAGGGSGLNRPSIMQASNHTPSFCTRIEFMGLALSAP